MKQKVLLIGSGAREHAVGWKLLQNKSVELLVWGSSRNPGLLALATEYQIGRMDDIFVIVAWAQEHKADWAFVGPELPLSVGVVDALAKAHIPAVGPTRVAAQLETSKSFARELLVEAEIGVCPRFRTFGVVGHGLNFFGTETRIPAGRRDRMHPSPAQEQVRTDASFLTQSSFKKIQTTSHALWCESLDHSFEEVKSWVEELNREFVVKPDGLTGGKGVRVQGDHFETAEEGIAYAKECLEKDGRVILEEKLVGQEFSLMSFCDGHTLVHMPAVQDNKRLRNGDQGPNTGGMGSVSDEDGSLPFLLPADLLAAGDTNIRVVDALRARGIEYRGILYGNYMATRDGIKLIEYNARFGDPEAMNIMLVLETDMVDICQGIMRGTLESIPIRFTPRATVVKYVVPEGYPGMAAKDVKITVGSVQDEKTHLFFAAVDERKDGLYLMGSRAVAVASVDYTMAEAQVLCEMAVREVKGPVMHRSDIGTSELMQQRTAMMSRLRD